MQGHDISCKTDSVKITHFQKTKQKGNGLVFKGFTGIIAYPITQNELVIEDSDELNQGQQPGICGTVLQNTVYAKKINKYKMTTTWSQDFIWPESTSLESQVQNWEELYLPVHFPIVCFLGFWLFWTLYSDRISTTRIGIPAKAAPNQLGFFVSLISKQNQKDKRLLLLLLCYYVCLFLLRGIGDYCHT